MISQDFRIAHHITKGNEGFYTPGTGKTADDPGGETVLGLTRGAEPDSTIWPIVEAWRLKTGFPDNMERDPALHEAAQVTYKKKYWDPLGLDAVNSQLIQCELFDAGVNLGLGYPLIYLQLTLNSFNQKGTLWPDMPIDGKLNPAMATAINIMCSRRRGEDTLYRALNAWQGVYYMVGKTAFKALVDSFKSLTNQDWRETFEWGWFWNRVVPADQLRHEIADAEEALGLTA